MEFFDTAVRLNVTLGAFPPETLAFSDSAIGVEVVGVACTSLPVQLTLEDTEFICIIPQPVKDRLEDGNRVDLSTQERCEVLRSHVDAGQELT